MTTTADDLVRSLARRTLDPSAIDCDTLPPSQRLLVAAARLAGDFSRVDRGAIEARVRELRSCVSAASRQPGELEATLRAVTIPEPAIRPLQMALSAALARAGDERALEAAVQIGEAALAASPMREGAALAMRLVRWYEELDRPDAIERAYVEAVRRNPLSAWIVPPTAIGPAAERAEREAIDASEGGPRIVREAVRALRTGSDRAGALARLEAEAANAPEQVAPALLLCVERLRVAAALDPTSRAGELERTLDDARGYASRLGPLGAVAVLAQAMIAVLAGERERAIEVLAAGLPQIEDSRAAAAKIADALERELRVPPHAIDDILRRAFFEALLDPFGAFEPPRSALAQLRHWIAGAALALAVTGAVAPSARADDGVRDEHAEVQAGDEDADDHAQTTDGGGAEDQEDGDDTDDDPDGDDGDDADGSDGDDDDAGDDDTGDDDTSDDDADDDDADDDDTSDDDTSDDDTDDGSGDTGATNAAAARVDTAGDGPRGGWSTGSTEHGGDGARGGWSTGGGGHGGWNYGHGW